jgi:hypothetical protein
MRERIQPAPSLADSSKGLPDLLIVTDITGLN